MATTAALEAPWAAEKVRRGVMATELARIRKAYRITWGALSEILGTSESTLRRREARRARLSPVESDRLYRIAAVARRAEEVFGGRDAAGEWLRRPIRAFGGTTPLSMLDTEPGYQEALAVLGRIDDGVYS